jgi:hypothetical protein
MMSAKVKLIVEQKKRRFAAVVWTHALPFVKNLRGILIHRPRSVVVYNLHKQSHMAIHYLCGNGTTAKVTNDSNIKFIPVPSNDSVVCERCETIAVTLSLHSASELAGTHVHVGRLKAAITCCGNNTFAAIRKDE